jgi:hypothetical protein
MATSGVLGTSPGGNRYIAAHLDAGQALQLSVETERSVGEAPLVVVHPKAFGDEAGLGTTVMLDPDAALDLAMRLVGCVVRLRKWQIGETS